MAQPESYNLFEPEPQSRRPERSLAFGGRSRREKIMAEITSGPGSEGSSSLPASPVSSGAEARLPYKPPTNAPLATTGQSEQTQVVSRLQPSPTALEEAVLKMPLADRIKFVLSLPPKERVDAMKVLRIEMAGGSGDDIRELFKVGVVAKSRFEQVREDSEFLAKVVRAKLPDVATQAKYDEMVAKNKVDMERLTNAALSSGVVKIVTDEIKKVYDEITSSPSKPSTRRRRSYFSESDSEAALTFKNRQERIAYVNAALQDYKEDFWQENDAVLSRIFGRRDIAFLREEYTGFSRYFAARVALAIKKEINGRPLAPGEEIGDWFLERIVKTELQAENAAKKERDAKQRQRERLRATPEQMLGYNDWRERFEFNWAETREELELSVFAWLEKFEKHLPNETAEIVHNEVGKWKANAISALEVAAHNLNISEKEPFFERLRSTVEAHINVLGGVKLLESDGGFEPYTGYLEAFAHNFNAHHDSIYLGHAKSAIIQAYLARNHGEIALGAHKDKEKPVEGELTTFRETIEEQAKAYAATHELYIKDSDFKEAVLLGRGFRQQTILTIAAQFPHLSPDQLKQYVDGLVHKEINTRESVRSPEDRRYWWDDDVIEELLLVDSRGLASAQAKSPDPNSPERKEAEKRVETRINVFIKIKKRLEEEDLYEDNPGHFVSLASLNPDQRKEVIRERIMAQMELVGQGEHKARVNTITNPEEKDRELWNWLREYNQTREKQGKSLFFPSKWDQVRLSINTATKLVDRALSEIELDSMIEKVGKFRSYIEGKGFVELDIDGLTDKGIKDKVEAITELTDTEKQELLEDALFNRQQRKAEAERTFNINRNYQKFLGVDARWGGLVSRIVNDNGETELITISELAESILKDKIDLEVRAIEEKVDEYERALRLEGKLTDEQIADKKIWHRRLLRRDATFGATLALRELGAAHDLPIWNYDFFNDPRLVGEIAPYLGYTHGDKPKIADLLDKGRRELRAVYDYLADEHMDGKILVVRHEPSLEFELELDPETNKPIQTKDPVTGRDKFYMDGTPMFKFKLDASGKPISKAHHEESRDRKRVVNEGGEMVLRDIFECRFMLSTSGGVEVPSLISKIGDLGIYDLLWEMGAKDFREFQGFIKRRDEVELARQSLWNTKKWKDPISYAKRLREAGAAKVFLTGGNTKEGYVHGVLIEPLSGAYKYRDEFVKVEVWINSSIKEKLAQKHSTFKTNIQDIVENEDNYQDLTVEEKDRLTEIGAGIIKPLIDYLDRRRYVMNRGGRTPTNWKLDNELIIKAYFEEMFKRDVPEVKDSKGNVVTPAVHTVLGEHHLDYALPGRSKLAIKIFKGLLKTSSYHGLTDQEVEDLNLSNQDQEAQRKINAKRKELTDGVTQHGLPAAVQSKINNRENKLRAQGMGQRIDSLTNRLRLLGMTQPKIDSLGEINEETKKQLLKQGVSKETLEDEINSFNNIRWEIRRIANQHIEEQVHRQVVGEWAVCFHHLVPLPKAA